MEVIIVVRDESDRQAAGRLIAALEQLDRDGGMGPILAHTTRLLLATGRVGIADALEAIEASVELATGTEAGEVTDEQATKIMRQMAVRHLTGVAG